MHEKYKIELKINDLGSKFLEVTSEVLEKILKSRY